MSRITISSMLALILAIGYSGCSDTDQARVVGNPFQGLQLELAVPQHGGFQQYWKPLLDEWSAQTGASTRIVEYTAIAPTVSTGDSNPLVNVLKRDSAETNTSDPSIVVFPITRVAELHAGNWLATIPDSLLQETDLNWFDLFQGLRDQIGSIQREPTIVPLSCPVFVCYYRKDLFEANSLTAPETWDDYQVLLDTIGTWAPGFQAVEPWGKAYRATMFLARAVSYAKHPANYSLFFDIQSGEPLIDSPGFTRAFEVSLAALAKMPQQVVSYTPRHCRRAILSGRAAMAITFETGLGSPALAFGPAAADNELLDRVKDENTPGAERVDAASLGFCRLPGASQVYNLSNESWQTPPEGGTNVVTLTAFGGLCAAVTTQTEAAKTQAAWNLLTALAVHNLGTAIPRSARSLCRESQLMTAATCVGEDLSVEEIESYSSVVAQSLRDANLVAELPVVGRQLYRDSLTESIGRVLSKERSPAEALATTARKWRNISEEAGTDVVRDSYRSCLGLSPAPKP